ncbi:MAG TPA: sigma factor-like helix-turn-helix DNA-binding protein [Dongiaceae bacterium]|nr:sigma factor-like helix-turn-helix DNA-binding protein [Dongiaceae bacterium]
MAADIERYRNLADWPESAWKNLDIHLFIIANFNRYCANLVKKVGIRHLPSDAVDSLPGLFCDVAHKPLTAVYQRNLDAQGQRRNQIMLGTLKMISYTRMVDALIKEYPCYVSLDRLPEPCDTDYESKEEFVLTDIGIEQASETPLMPFDGQYVAPLYAANVVEPSTRGPDSEDNGDERLSMMLELLRSQLTPVQYWHVRYAICEGLDCQEIAERTGCSVSNTRAMLYKARKRMLQLVPAHLRPSIQACLHRK